MQLMCASCTETHIVLSDQNQIDSIDIPNTRHLYTIEGDTIRIEVAPEVDITSLSIYFFIPDQARISLENGRPADYSEPVTYTVTAQSGNPKSYVVCVSRPIHPKILYFGFPNLPYEQKTTDDGGFLFQFYQPIDLSRLTPVIVCSPGTTVSPASGETVDLRKSTIYTLVTANGTRESFVVSASNNLSTQCTLLTFSLDNGAPQTVEFDDRNVYVYTTHEANISHTQANFKVSPYASAEPAAGAFLDFSSPVEITVTSSDGKHSDTYRIVVRKSPWRRLLANGEAPFLQVDGHQTVVFDDYMWVLGGWRGCNNPWDPAGDYFSSQIFRSRDGISWENMGDAPWAGRHGFGCVVYDGKIWIMSGDDHTDIWNSSDGVNWFRVLETAPWGPRYFGTYAVFGGKIWVLGGQSVYDPATMWLVYDDVWSSTDGVNWTREIAHTPIPPRALILGSAVKNDVLYIIGGGTLGGSPRGMEYNDVWSTADGVNWRRLVLEAPFKPIYWHSVGEHEGSLYVVGGFHRGNTHTNEVWSSPDGVRWTRQKYPFFEPRHAQSVVSFRGNLYMIGGTIDPPSNKDTRNDVWMMEDGF